MSLWSRNQLRIALAPQGLALVRHHGNPAKPVASKSVASPVRDWQSLLPLLERELADAAWRAPQVEVVLSNQYVRYALTPPPGKALSQPEETALVSASFREIYGAETASWRIRVLSQPPQFGLVGAAIDESLIIEIGDLLKRHRYTNWAMKPLASLTPQPTADWWVLAEPGWLCLFNAVGGHWRYLSGQPADDHWQRSLPETLNREARMAGCDLTGKPQTAFIQSFGSKHRTPAVSPGWHWRMATPNNNELGALALAMA